ncbi:uncharacterized protein FIBRA_00981 [Fibroporia radiculosa]|uniref:TPR-like protein n=1 Tax=Fibroporia radiculosa TaxID=599839 RepID=J4G0Q5_9APHY|nr:uncharacterized protein FIBRA_00981 [Fibroporia radiculosa]CCL98973.1 predicted protein [Fibroporia radiculosa]
MAEENYATQDGTFDDNGPQEGSSCSPADSQLHEEEAHLRDSIVDANASKIEGNDHFRAQRWDEALVAYRFALGRLPKRNPRTQKGSGVGDKGKEREDPLDDDDGFDTPGKPADPPKEDEFVEPQPPSGLELECAKARSVINANIGACYVKLGDHKEAVAASLIDDPQYIKALQRRAASNEQIGSWPSLTSAQEDYNTLLGLLPPTSSQVAEIKRTLQLLKPRLEAAQKQETAEMMDKLKGLGNNILGTISPFTYMHVPHILSR